MSIAFLACSQRGCRGSPALWGTPLTPAKLTPLWTAVMQRKKTVDGGPLPLGDVYPLSTATGQLREMIASHKDLAKKLVELEKKYDAQFKVVFDAIRQLMASPVKEKKQIGF
jgi:hypothetical protein